MAPRTSFSAWLPRRWGGVSLVIFGLEFCGWGPGACEDRTEVGGWVAFSGPLQLLPLPLPPATPQGALTHEPSGCSWLREGGPAAEPAVGDSGWYLRLRRCAVEPGLRSLGRLPNSSGGFVPTARQGQGGNWFSCLRGLSRAGGGERRGVSPGLGGPEEQAPQQGPNHPFPSLPSPGPVWRVPTPGK